MALSDTHLGYRLAAAGAVTNPELLLEYQRQVLAHATETADPGQSAARDGNETRQRAGVENARHEPTDSADA